MAHLQGTDYVGSMVVLEDGLPNKREYRRFRVKDVPGNDDYAAMEEVLTRRLTAYLAERDRPINERRDRPGKFAYPPQLLVVDGGKGQLGVAKRVVESLGLADEIPVAGLAKRFEEVYVPDRSEPVEIPRGSEALFMLQRIRDEAHRFANTFHVERRSKRMTASSLDGIPGLGETRKTKLVKAMGGVNAVKRAALDDLKSLPFLPDAVAEAIHARFERAAAGPSGQESPSREVGGDLGAEAVDLGETVAELAAEVPLRHDELVEPELAVGADRVDQFGRRPDDGPAGGSVGA
jgi:excinuclease ABC subunit C